MDQRERLAAWREGSGYMSVDPAPPQHAPEVPADIVALRGRLLDRDLPMFQRMRAVFALRNVGGHDAVDALVAAFEDPSALLRHEIAYVLGQMGDPHALPALRRVLSGEGEHVMVRHEAAEAMGAIGDPSSRDILQRFCDDPHPEVAESCVVALDLLDWMASKELEY